MDEYESIPIEVALPFVKDMDQLHSAIAAFFQKSGGSPVPDSQADAEVRAYTQPRLVKTAYAQANLLLNSADDHMMAFSRVMQEPVNTIASWTLVRGAVEAAALSAWFYDPRIDARERVKRSFAYRYEGIEEERKLANSIGKVDDVNKCVARLDFLVNEASSLGYDRVLNNKRKTIGIGIMMPSNTAVIRELYGEEAQYRILSAMAHSLPYAISQLAHRQISPEARSAIQQASYNEDQVPIERHMSAVSLSVMCHWLALAMAKPIWYRTRLFGFDEAEMAQILDQATENHVKPNRRFWRHI
jgi:hypothetical protein